jgi:hypothetical protein
MVVSDPQISSLLSGQIIRSGQHGQYLITRETVEDMHCQLQERPVPVNIEYDPTVPTVGRITGSRLLELENGELALETDTEIFEGTVPAALYSNSDLASAAQVLEHLPAEAGPIDVIVDDRSYAKEDLEALRVIMAEVGDATAGTVHCDFRSYRTHCWCSRWVPRVPPCFGSVRASSPSSVNVQPRILARRSERSCTPSKSHTDDARA